MKNFKNIENLEPSINDNSLFSIRAFTPNDDPSEFWAIYVLQKYQGVGIGKKLFNAIRSPFEWDGNKESSYAR